MRKFFSEFLADEAGVAAPLVALSMSIIIGIMAVTLEVGYWRKSKTDLQLVADMAAYAGAIELLASSSDDAKTAAALQAFTNGYNASKGSIAVHSPALTGAYQEENSVEVNISQKGYQFFSAIIGNDKVTYNVRAVASFISLHEACVLALDKTTSNALRLTGSLSVDMTGCSLAANSSSADAVSLSGASSVVAECIIAVGGINGAASHADLECEADKPNSPTIKDPYAEISAPDLADYPVCETPTKTSKWDYEMTPGRYCGNIKIKGTTELAAGTYIFDGMNANFIGAHALLTGDDVTIILMNNASLNGINGQATIDISAPTVGDYAGIAIFSDPITQHSGATVKINGGSQTAIDGLMYFPTQNLQFSGNTQVGNGCTLLVANTITMTGNANFDMTNCESLYGLDVPSLSGIYIVE